MAKSLENILRDTLAACEKLLVLARGGDDASEDTAARMLFGRMRDAAYELRRLAARHLSSGESTVGAGGEAAERRLRVSEQEVLGDDDEGGVSSEATEAAPRHVLVVDDDPDVVMCLTRWFEDRGFSVDGAMDGAEALRLVATGRPDLITLDIRMPGESGLEVLRQLKADPELGAIPVIVLTGTTEAVSARGDAPAGPLPEGILAKPFELHDLATLVKRLVA